MTKNNIEKIGWIFFIMGIIIALSGNVINYDEISIPGVGICIYPNIQTYPKNCITFYGLIGLILIIIGLIILIKVKFK